VKSSPVGNVAEVFNGKTPSKTEQRTSGYPVLKIRDVDEVGNFRGSFSGFVDRDLADKHVRKKIVGGETLILNAAHSSTHVASKTFYASQEVESAIATGEWLMIRWNPSLVDERYGFHWVNLPKTRFLLRRLVNGIHLYPKDVQRLIIPLPPLDEQKRIARILDQADAHRAKRRETIKQLDALVQSVFLDMFGDPVTNPKGWIDKPLGELCPNGFRNGISPSTNGTYHGVVLTLSAITGKRFDGSKTKVAVFDNEPQLDQRVDKNLFLICRGNGNNRLVGSGKFAAAKCADTIFPDTMIACRPDPELLEPAFFEIVWESEAVRRQVETMARTTNGTHKINQKSLASIRLPLPSLEKQTLFQRFFEKTTNLRLDMEQALYQLDSLFSSLQSRAFKGEL
jgi:type I restriction enzyme, S subunit